MFDDLPGDRDIGRRLARAICVARGRVASASQTRLTERAEWCYSLLYREILFHPLPAHKTLSFRLRLSALTNATKHFRMHRSYFCATAHTSVARRPAVSTRPQQRGLRVVDLRRHALHLRRRVLSAIRRRRVLRRGRLLRLHPFAAPLVEDLRA